MKHSEISAKHADASEACSNLQECFVAMGKEAGAGVEGTMYRKVASHFQKLKEAHHGLSDLHAQGGDDSEKVDRDELGKLVEREVQATLSKTLQPDKITSVIPTDVPFGIRSVPRAGQPNIGGIDKAAVPPQFRHLVDLTDEV